MIIYGIWRGKILLESIGSFEPMRFQEVCRQLHCTRTITSCREVLISSMGISIVPMYTFGCYSNVEMTNQDNHV